VAVVVAVTARGGRGTARVHPLVADTSHVPHDTEPTPSPPLPAAATARLAQLLSRGRRVLLGIAGPPGAGKSTLAAALCAAAGGAAVVVPMDGFHLANSELVRLGRRHRKGAPDTFDANGYAALLRRLRGQVVSGDDAVIYAPEYRREFEEGVAGAIAVLPDTPLVIAEGNYLLLEEGAWAGIAALLDESWYVEADPTLRVERLARRHVQFGKTPAQASAWVADTDEPNARAIAATRARADWVFRWQEG
jgi:pantothenate kinase